MKEVNETCCCVVDHGLYLPLAHKLSETYARVLYHTPWERGYPVVNDCVLGDGFPKVERCDDFWEILEEIDLFVFPDILHMGLQDHLRSIGKPVWGSGWGSGIELDRLSFIDILKHNGLKVAPYTMVNGVTELRNHLIGLEDKYVKISKYRGTMETWHWRNADLDATGLDVLAVRLGSVREKLPFIIFDAIDTDIEVGGDTYNVHGKWPSHMLEAYEWKDKGVFGAVRPRREVADPIQEVMEVFGRVLEANSYANFFSMEVRVKDDEAYFIDPCCRGPMPMTGSQMEIYSNLAEIIWAGAHGVMVNPVPAAKFSCECVLKMKADKGEWSNVRVPEELEGWMKISYACRVDGLTGIPPDELRGEEIGWLVAIGDTPKTTIDLMLERADQLPDGVECCTNSLVDLLKEIEEADRKGLPLTDKPMPEPKDVI